MKSDLRDWIEVTHKYETHQEWYDAIEQVTVIDSEGKIKQDTIPWQLLWEYLRKDFESFEKFCEFVCDSNIESWAYEDPPRHICLRRSQCVEHAKKKGIL